MCVEGTPLEHYPELGLWVKREDLCCPPGPHFSKTRGVYAHIAKRPEKVIGVLDTYHSQGGWAVAQACRLLGKNCVEFYPVRKATPGWFGEVQERCRDLGAATHALPAGRSAVLYHQAKKMLAAYAPPADATQFNPDTAPVGTYPNYMMPNALKLPEMITETVAEVARTFPGQTAVLPGTVIVSASSGTIAAGVLKGLALADWRGTFIVHQGYDRSQEAISGYMAKMMAWTSPFIQPIKVRFVNEGYAYGDQAKPGPLPPFPCNEFYDLKAFRWWVREGRERYREALLWNIG